MSITRKAYVLYDGRAMYLSPDDCAVFDTASSEAEAEQASKDSWNDYDCVWFEYDVVDGKLVNEKRRLDIGESYLLRG